MTAEREYDLEMADRIADEMLATPDMVLERESEYVARSYQALRAELQAAQEREQKLRAELKRVSNRAFQWKDAYEARLAAFKLLAAQRTEEPSE